MEGTKEGRWVPMYDSFMFSPTEQNYDTYKRELKVIVVFAAKYAHMLSGSKTSTIWTDHQPLTTFLKGNNHQDIFYRYLENLRPLDIAIKHVKGKKNAAADGLSRTIFPDSDAATCFWDLAVREGQCEQTTCSISER